MKSVLNKVFLILVSAVIMLPLVPVMAATALPDSTPTIVTKKCYRNVLEPADFLIVWEHNIPYAVPPTDPVTETFLWEMIDSDGVTVLGSSTGWPYEDDGYNYQCGSMYWDAASAMVWDPLINYTLRLSGNPIAFVAPPEYNFTVASGDYSTAITQEDAQEELRLDVLLIAADLDIRWGLLTSLIFDDETGQTLSVFGQAYFRGAIYGIQALAPGLFPLAITEIDIADRTWTETYVTALETQYAGTWVEIAKAGGATLFGTSYDLLSVIIMFALVIGIFIGDIMVTGDHWHGAVDVAFILIITAKLSFYGLGYLGLIVAMAFIYLNMRLFRFPH